MQNTEHKIKVKKYIYTITRSQWIKGVPFRFKASSGTTKIGK